MTPPPATAPDPSSVCGICGGPHGEDRCPAPAPAPAECPKDCPYCYGAGFTCVFGLHGISNEDPRVPCRHDDCEMNRLPCPRGEVRRLTAERDVLRNELADLRRVLQMGAEIARWLAGT